MGGSTGLRSVANKRKPKIRLFVSELMKKECVYRGWGCSGQAPKGTDKPGTLVAGQPEEECGCSQVPQG